MPVGGLAIAGIIAGGSALVKGIGGAIQTHKANKALKELNSQKQPDYSVSPELLNAYNRAEAMSKYGYSPQEQAQFQQQLARSQVGQQRAALDMSGGNLSGAIGGVLQAQQTGALNEFAAKDAGLHRDNVRYADEMARDMQTQKNLIDQQKIQRMQLLQEAYGQAKQQGSENIWGAVNQIGNIGTAMIGNRYGQEPSSPSAGTMNALKFDPTNYAGNDPETI